MEESLQIYQESDDVPHVQPDVPLSADDAPPDGVPLQPDGVPLQPDGVPLQPDGVPLQPDGVPLQPDGVPLQPDGVPLTDSALSASEPDLTSIAPYDREPQRSFLAFKDYVRMGRNRSLDKLAKDYIGTPGNDLWTNNYESVLKMLKVYSAKWSWQERLRHIITQASAEVLAAAQKDALLHAKERIRVARIAQKYGITIIEKACLNTLTVGEARKLLRPGAAILKLGLDAERAETGESIAVIRPEKPIRDMSDEELNTYADILLRVVG